ncbi:MULTISPECIES: stage II sporulation protein E [unclassified Candidatus Frackibacter]|uniref:stage II sporulation protein E n=1 Tax=unclassified Candidatus Frackibacter TaxID=2648818 RepID=UPI0008906F1D|nr:MULTISPECIES: stage II sporulation protein E [unclassified Candidatus Frackibacter]SDC66946.1 stage II sporulation protein E [Candidatus Frackibacter sp. WG11]SEM80207.1 stage II sporulation protein E [Candidatus Frackibacter sp. WG12]SFL90728.1 stage II sporulation protein E [Candidatus Frackibacter sp. WG13]
MLVETDLPIYKRLKENDKTKLEVISQLVKEIVLEFDLLHLVYVCLGVVIGRASLSANLLPFGLAFLGVSVYQKLYKSEGISRVVFFIISIYIGYYTALGWSWLFAKYLLAGILFSLASLVFLYGKQRVSKIHFAMLNAGVLLVIEVINIFLASKHLYYNLTLLLGVVLVGVLTLVLLEGLSPLLGAEKREELEEINILALLITLASLSIGFPNVNIGVVNLSRVFSDLMIMLVAINGGGTVATVVGVVIGLFYSISNLYVIEVTGLYALAGLISGNFKREGKLGVIIGFSLTILLYTIFLIELNSINAVIGEALLAGGILVLLPDKIIESLGRWIPGSKAYSMESQQEEMQNKIVNRVNEISDVFIELANTFQQVSRANPNQSDNVEELLSIITNQVCVECEYYSLCWEQEFFKTYQRSVEVLSVAENQGGISSKVLSQVMHGECRMSVEFSETANRLLEKYETNNFWQKKLKDSKEVIGNQLLGVSQLLEAAASDLAVDIRFDNNLEKVIQSELELYGIFTKKVSTHNIENEMRISLTKESCAGNQECKQEIIPILNQALDQKFQVSWNKCGGHLGKQYCSLEITPTTTYRVETGVAQVSPGQKEISGDNYKVIDADDEETISILSDGMGRGERAALESQTTVDLLEKLITAGFDKKLAIKTVNSALLLRSAEEVFATVDISAINCYTGQTEFIKVGSAPTFIKRDSRKIDLVKSTSLPIGIMDNIDIELTQQMQISPGDMIIMVTDGILDSQEDEIKQEEWMMRLLRNNLINDPQSLADYILEQAIEAKQEISDDMTVVVTKLNSYRS